MDTYTADANVKCGLSVSFEIYNCFKTTVVVETGTQK